MKKPFYALTTLSNVFWGMGWLCVIAAIIIYFVMSEGGGIGAAIALLISIGVALLGLFLFAFGELIKLFLKIEENTRKPDFGNFIEEE